LLGEYVSREILVVEDDRALARSIARALEAKGYTTRQVHDGDGALREVARAAPDLILLDLLLPKKDGRSVLMTLQASTATREIPVIAMSGIFRGRDHHREITLAGAKDLLEKPFSASVLLASLRKVLGVSGEEKTTGPKRVQLADRPVAEVLWEAMEQGFSGAVHFQSGRRHKQVLLEAGTPKLIRSNVTRECLGRRLLDTGQIDEVAYRESVQCSKNSERPQGGILVRMGALPEAQLSQALATQSEEKLLDLFRWTEGETWRQEGVRQLPQASELLDWTPQLTILKGVEVMDCQRITERLRPHADSPVTRKELALSEAECTASVKALLEALGSESRVADLMEAHAPALYGLWVIDALGFGEKAVGASPASSSLAKLQSLCEAHKGQTYFEVLGVPEDAATSDLRRAFVGLAKRYHPDRFNAESKEVQALAAEVFANISLAHDTLSDPAMKKAYLARMRGAGPSGSSGEVARIVSAEGEFRNGERLLKQRAFEQALEHFRRALELDPSEGEFSALYGWTLFLVNQNDPETRTEAIRRLEEAQTLAPRSPSGYYYLGLLWKACDQARQADRMFRKVLEVSPDHVEAARERRLYRMRRQGSGRSNRSGLFGLGRKKK
jgi:CheY-like chemotaxis protein/curved DNA-binding protein CbpA